VAILLPILLVL